MSGAHLDTVDALMAQYAAGILPAAAQVLVAAHLEMKVVNRSRVLGYEMTAGEILETIEPVALSARNKVFSSVMAAGGGADDRQTKALSRPVGAILPQAIHDFVGFEVEDIPWKTKLPGFKEHIVGKIDGCEVSFFWIRPGRAVPAHTHEGFELSLILDGAFNDARGRFGKGDISVADDSIDHRPVAEKERPCIGFAVADAPVKLTGSLRQLLGDLIG